MNVMMDLRTDLVAFVMLRAMRLKSFRMRVDQARMSVMVIMTKEEGRVMRPMVRRRRYCPELEPHSLCEVS